MQKLLNKNIIKYIDNLGANNMKILKWIFSVDNFKAILRQKKMSQKELAQRLGVHQMTISAWCSGKCQPTDKTFEELIKILEVPEEKLKTILPTSDKQLALIADTRKKEQMLEEAENENNLRELIKLALKLLALINDYQMLRRQSPNIQEDSTTNRILTNAKIKLLEHIKELEEQELRNNS